MRVKEGKTRLLIAGIATGLVTFTLTLLNNTHSLSYILIIPFMAPMMGLLISPMMTFRVRVSLKQKTNVPIDFFTVCGFAITAGSLAGLCVLLPLQLAAGPVDFYHSSAMPSLFNSSMFIFGAFCIVTAADFILHFVIDRPLSSLLVPAWLKVGMIVLLVLSCISGYMGYLAQQLSFMPLGHFGILIFTAILMLYPIGKFLGLWRIPALEKTAILEQPSQGVTGAPIEKDTRMAVASPDNSESLGPISRWKKYRHYVIFIALWFAAVLAFIFISPLGSTETLALFVPNMLFFSIFLTAAFIMSLWALMRKGKEIKWLPSLYILAVLPFLLVALYLALMPSTLILFKDALEPISADLPNTPSALNPFLMFPMAIAAIADMLLFVAWKKPYKYPGIPRSMFVVMGLHMVLLITITFTTAAHSAQDLKDFGLGFLFVYVLFMFLILQAKYIVPREMLG